MENINILDILRLLLNKLWLIVLAGLVCAAAVFIYTSNYATPIYQAKSSILVSNGGIKAGYDIYAYNTTSGYISGSDISASASIKQTCIDILQTDKFFKKLANELDMGYSSGALRNMTSVASRSDDSLFLDIRVNGTNKTEVVEIAKVIAEISPDYIKDVLASASPSTIELPTGASRISPQVTRSTIIAFILGMFIVVIPLAIISITDKTIKGEDDFSEKYEGISILGVVPDFIATSNAYGSNYGKGEQKKQ